MNGRLIGKRESLGPGTDAGVAKAIGWSHDPNAEIGCGRPWGKPGEPSREHWWPKYTVDDLLSWLHPRTGALTINVGTMSAPGDWAWVLWSGLADCDEAFGPTLLEALELAVLAVVGASS